MVYAGNTNAKMSSAWLCKILLVLWMTQCRVAINPSSKLDCGDVENRYNISCEGNNITLSCPEEKPRMQITRATFGRTQDERKLCLRPGNKTPGQSKSVKCVQDVASKVEEICADQLPCVFNVNNVTFHDPCPQVYKYMWVRFNCNCRRRYTRNTETTSTCIPKKPNATSSTYTIIHPTPTLTTIGQSMSQNVTNSTYVPIKMTVKPTTTVSTQSLTIKATISVKSSKNITLLAQHVRGRNKAFFLLLELFVIYNEAANEDPPMALMWCFIGILLGLFIITITFLILGIRRKPKHKKLFSLSQLESEEGEIQSPTIHTSSQFPESLDLERRQAAVEKLKAKRGTDRPVSKNFPGMGSWSDLLKADTSLYINPLWRGWQEEYLSLTAQGGEAELDTGQDEREGLSRSEPWNLSAAAQSDDIDHRDGQGNTDSNGSSNRNSSNSDSSSQRNSGSDNINDNNNTINNQQPYTSHTNPEQSTSNTDPSRIPTNKRRSVGESDPNFITSIPVGIPSHPVPDPKIFHTEPTRTKKPEVSNTTPEVSNTTKPEVAEDNGNQLSGEKSCSSTNDYKNPSNKLLSKFGIYSDDVCPTPSLCNTALSSPCLFSEEFNHPTSGKHDLKGSPRAVTRLKVRSRPIRSRSLDSYSPAQSTPLHNTYNATPHNPTPNNLTSQNPTAHNPTISQHQNKRPPFVKNKNSPSLWPKVLVDDKTNTQSQGQNEHAQNVPVTKRLSKKSPTDSRASSGYYSNNTSPLVEYPAEITSSQNSGKKTEQKLQKQPSDDDDLPPLPPPPLPLIPISPLPHMCVSGYREAKTKDENNLDKNPSRTAVRKVHFKSSE